MVEIFLSWSNRNFKKVETFDGILKLQKEIDEKLHSFKGKNR